VGYIVAFTKVLTIYQIYHTWIYPLHHFPSSPSPHSRNSFNRYHFSTYIHGYTGFAPYSPSYTLSPPPPTCISLPRQDILDGKSQTYDFFFGIHLCSNISKLKDFTSHTDWWLFVKTVKVTYLNSECPIYLTGSHLAWLAGKSPNYPLLHHNQQHQNSPLRGEFWVPPRATEARPRTNWASTSPRYVFCDPPSPWPSTAGSVCCLGNEVITFPCQYL
jgi:hypothetical protein